MAGIGVVALGLALGILTVTLVGIWENGQRPAAAEESAAPTAPAQAAPGVTLPGGDAVAGKTTFLNTCNKCHPGAKEGIGPDISGVGVGDPANIIASIRNGSANGMPAFGPDRLTDKEVADLVAYLQKLAEGGQ